MNCDFCGAPHATRMEIPDLRYPEIPDDPEHALFLSRWGHPLTGKACRECLVGQLLKASGGTLVPASLLNDIRERLQKANDND